MKFFYKVRSRGLCLCQAPRTLQLLLSFVFLFFVCEPNSAIAQSWVSHGPDGGLVNSLATDQQRPDVVYAGTNEGGMFKSVNRGASWKTSDGGDLGRTTRVLTVQVAPSDSRTVFAVTDAGLLKSSNAGGAWKVVLKNGPGHFVRVLAIDPTNSAIVYAAFQDDGLLFKSTDGGATWGAASIGRGSAVIPATALAVDPQTPTTLYVGTNQGIFKSVNGGLSFNGPLDHGEPFHVAAVAVDPRTPTNVYVATRDGGVLKSPDGGELRWMAIDSGLADPNRVSTMVVDPRNSGTLYAIDANVVFKTTDGGTNWSAADSGLPTGPLNTLAIDATASSLYAGTQSTGVFKSVDGAGMWRPASRGLVATTVQALAIDPTRPTTAFAGTRGGLARSTNGGRTWNNIAFANVLVEALVVAPSVPKAIYAGTGSMGLQKSTDNGNTWSSTGLADSRGSKNVFVTSLAVDPKTPTTVYAATEATFNHAINKSTDGGATWQVTSLNGIFNAVVVDPKTPTTVYAAGQLNTGAHGVFKSTDGGATWSSVSTGLPSGGFGLTVPERALVIDPKTPTTLYVTVVGGVFKTTNGGANWSAVNTGLPVSAGRTTPDVDALAVDPNSPATVYAGIGFGSFAGVFRSTDGGAHWSAFNNGLPTPIDVVTLAVARTTPGTPYAGTGGAGVFVTQPGHDHEDDQGDNGDNQDGGND